jgi:hypothetical protein
MVQIKEPICLHFAFFLQVRTPRPVDPELHADLNWDGARTHLALDLVYGALGVLDVGLEVQRHAAGVPAYGEGIGGDAGGGEHRERGGVGDPHGGGEA